MISYLISKKGLQHQNPHVFTRSVMGSIMVKMFLSIIAAFIYISIYKKQINKPAQMMMMTMMMTPLQSSARPAVLRLPHPIHPHNPQQPHPLVRPMKVATTSSVRPTSMRLDLGQLQGLHWIRLAATRTAATQKQAAAVELSTLPLSVRRQMLEV